MKLSKHERETVISFNEADKTAEIQVYNAKPERRLEQLCKDRPEEITLIRRDDNGAL